MYEELQRVSSDHERAVREHEQAQRAHELEDERKAAELNALNEQTKCMRQYTHSSHDSDVRRLMVVVVVCVCVWW